MLFKSSRAIARGPFRVAEVEIPPSPELPLAPVPAIVEITPVATVSFRI